MYITTNPICMKYLLLVSILFIAGSSYAQDYMEKAKMPPSTVPAATTFEMYGYIDGKRLDSVEAVYATIDWRPQDLIRFDYGQQVSKMKQYAITDAKGVPMIFPNNTTAFLLNFFYYNGWELKEMSAAGGGTTIILRKRSKGN